MRMDGIVFKVRENSKVINKTIYLAVGLNREGRKEVLGMWLGKNESSSFLDERFNGFKRKKPPTRRFFICRKNGEAMPM